VVTSSSAAPRTGVRERWWSRRAVLLHLALLVWVPGCLVAFWWQVHRAFDGNGLSYLYSIEWPIFALVGVYAWWALLHTDPESVGRRAQQKLRASSGRVVDDQRESRRRDKEDPELAAYNDRLAELAKQGPKTWRHR
jgi:DNA-binding transcriptional regulator of glucitol operon